MWNGKNKALTLSYDDGVESDIKLVEILNEYGLKCTFNLNSRLMTPKSFWICNLMTIRRMPPEGMRKLYKGHEIAVHCATHANLTELDDEAIRHEILDDKEALERIFGCTVNGMAYPYGAYDDRVVSIAKECGMKFARTVNDRHDTKFPEDLMSFGASCHHDYCELDTLADNFINYSGDRPVVFCLWGHSYEFMINNNWDKIENFCRKVSGHDDIFYGTNSEVYLEK